MKGVGGGGEAEWSAPPFIVKYNKNINFQSKCLKYYIYIIKLLALILILNTFLLVHKIECFFIEEFRKDNILGLAAPGI